jgi:hypothetical protein
MTPSGSSGKAKPVPGSCIPCRGTAPLPLHAPSPREAAGATVPRRVEADPERASFWSGRQDNCHGFCGLAAWARAVNVAVCSALTAENTTRPSSARLLPYPYPDSRGAWHRVDRRVPANQPLRNGSGPAVRELSGDGRHQGCTVGGTLFNPLSSGSGRPWKGGVNDESRTSCFCGHGLDRARPVRLVLPRSFRQTAERRPGRLCRTGGCPRPAEASFAASVARRETPARGSLMPRPVAAESWSRKGHLLTRWLVCRHVWPALPYGFTLRGQRCES